jgi:hypothetical protein
MSDLRRTLLRPGRRTFLRRLVLGCAGLLSARAWLSAASDEPALLLARRLASIIAVPAPLAFTPAVVVEHLTEVFGATDFAALLTLEDAQLKQLIGARIQQQYQQGAVVLHRGWWLARSEAALLRLI